MTSQSAPSGLQVVGVGPFGPPGVFFFIFDGNINQDGPSLPIGLEVFFAVEGWVGPSVGASAQGTTGVQTFFAGTGSPTMWRVTQQPTSFLLPPGTVAAPQSGPFPFP